MVHQKKATTLLALATLVLLATAATTAPRKKFKNLQILPQDISEKQLDSIMDTYSKALKVSCEFCHLPPKNNFPLTITTTSPSNDYSSDNEMKENARRMMRMTIDINKKYFNFDTTIKPEFINVITCNTCHRGNPFPAHE